MAHLSKKTVTRSHKDTLTNGILGLLRRQQELPDFRRLHLGLESLETRSLMAVAAMDAGVQATMQPDTSLVAAFQGQTQHGPLHNSFDPEDVDDDGSCSASDVMTIVNAINANATNSSSKFIDVDGDGQCTAMDVMMVINRINRGGGGGGGGHQQPGPAPTPTPPVATSEVRSIDGTGNNTANTTWGSTNVDLLRTAPAAYGDRISSPAGADRPSARAISNSVSDQAGQDILNSRQLSAMSYAWGQFIDHDMDLTPTGGTDVLKIDVPNGDPSFDPNSTGTQGIYTGRSIFDSATGTSTSNPRQQVNTITSFLDGSMVYGSDTQTAKELRTMSGGLMKTSTGNMLPLNDTATLGGPPLNMANDAHIFPDNELFAAGDVRANENIELTALQTLFVREHNSWAAKIAAANPSLTDEQIYQKARSIVIAEIESITFNQWLPAILGPGAVSAYHGYNPGVNPGIANEFSTAAFRFGHSIVGNDVEFMDNDGNETQDELPLAFAFFNPAAIKASGIDPLLKYLSSDVGQELDTKVVDSLRNFLFGPPGVGGLDLASLNIERGRDNGLADYNTVRVAYHLPPVTSFSQITSDPTLAAKLQNLYGSVNNIDLWVGGLAENHIPGGSMGPLFTAIIADQFQRLRDGDRFWYEGTMAGQQLSQIRNTTLADIIQRNTGVTGLQNNVFFFKSAGEGQVFADVNGNGVQDPPNEPGLGGITVQLLDEDGNIMGTTKTDRAGRFRFNQFGGAGDYHVQIVLPTGSKLTTDGLLDLHIASGDQFLKGLNFGLSLLNPPTKPATQPPQQQPPQQQPPSNRWASAVDSVFGGP
jgi:hypothetical protein